MEENGYIAIAFEAITTQPSSEGQAKRQSHSRSQPPYERHMSSSISAVCCEISCGERHHIEIGIGISLRCFRKQRIVDSIFLASTVVYFAICSVVIVWEIPLLSWGSGTSSQRGVLVETLSNSIIFCMHAHKSRSIVLLTRSIIYLLGFDASKACEVEMSMH